MTRFLILTVLLTVAGYAAAESDAGSTFTYQGRLNSGGSPASGIHDFEFGLYDAETTGAQVGTTVSLTTHIAGGLFSAPLDFGASAFSSGASRWLHIAVAPEGSPTRVSLTPRVRLSPAPTAFYADAASTATTARSLSTTVADEVVAATVGMPMMPMGSQTTAWQSFTSELSGTLSRITNTMIFVPPGETVTWSLYSGEGTGGTLLAQETSNGTGGNYTFSAGPSLDSGTVYTIEISGTVGFVWPVSMTPYSGGTNNLGSDYGCTIFAYQDPTEQTLVSATGANKVYINANVGINEQNPDSKLHISGVPGVDGIRYPDGSLQTKAFTGSADYATNADHASSADNATSADHADTADSATNANHATTADGATNASHATTADSATNATNAADSDKLDGIDSTGFAAAAHNHSSLDASDGAPADVVSVDGDGNVSIDGTDAMVEVNSSGINHSVYISGGSALDANQQVSNYMPAFANNQWQSFTAQTTGLLTKVEVYLQPWAVGPPAAMSVRFRIHEGEGISGPEIGQNYGMMGAWAGEGAAWKSANVFVPPLVTAGNKYTIRVYDGEGTPLGWGAAADPYPGGRSDVATDDHAFKISIQPVNSKTSALMIQAGTGRIGIGTQSPDYQLQLSTDSAAKPGTSSWTIASDARLKNLNAAFTRGLEALAKIHPVSFQYKEQNALGLPSENEYVGVVAQEVQAAVPEAVTTDDKGYLHMNTDAVFWTIVNSVKELKAENDELRKENEQFRNEKESLERRIERLEKAMEASE